MSIVFLQTHFAEMVEEMQASQHHYDWENLSPHHLEGDVWAHQMMVSAQCRDRDFDKYVGLYDNFLRNYYWNDSEFLCDMAIEFISDNYYVDTDINIKDIAMKWVNRGIEIDESDWYPHYVTAYIQYYYDDYTNAIENASHALDLLDDEETRESLTSFIMELEDALY